MGDFITSPTTPELFDDKEAAPGQTRRPGWTANNVLDADDVNAIKAALFDCRTAIRAQELSSAALVFGAINLTTDQHIPPGYSSATVPANVGMALPFEGTLTRLQVACVTNGATTASLSVKLDGNVFDTLEFTGETATGMDLDQAFFVGSVLSVLIEFTGSAPEGLVVSVAVESGATGA